MKSKIFPRYVLILFITISIIVSLGSCKKQKEKEIIGKWDLAPMSKNEQDNLQVWEFYEGDKLVVVEENFTDDVGNYFIETKLFHSFVNISDLDAKVTSQNGKYRIEKLKKDIMILHRIYDEEGGSYYVRKEFTKQ